MLRIHGLLSCLFSHKQAKLQCNVFCLFSGEALDCNFCYSDTSWSDCDSGSKQSSCDPSWYEDTCTKTYRVEKKGENVIHHYSKSCLPSSFCNGEECRMHSQSCRIDCCNTDACNESVFLNGNYMTFLMLALVIIVHLL